MLENKVSTEQKMNPRPTSHIRNEHLQQLQDEIDKLALLVAEAKRQSDRIQAAADAVGEAAFEDASATILPFALPDKRQRRKTDA